MMTQLIRSDSESPNGSEKSSPELSSVKVYGTDGSVRSFTRPTDPPTAATEPCLVYYLQVQQAPTLETNNFSDFDGLLDELEQDPEMAAQLQEGRKWVGETFYQESPTLASLRLALGLSQKQLGEVCGMEQPHISRYESGKHEPSLLVSKALAKALQVDLDIFAQAWENTHETLRQGIAK